MKIWLYSQTLPKSLRVKESYNTSMLLKFKGFIFRPGIAEISSNFLCIDGYANIQYNVQLSAECQNLRG